MQKKIVVKNLLLFKQYRIIQHIFLKIGKIMKYKVGIKKTEEGYSIWVPGLPGCWSEGKTEEEALENIKDAIYAYLETRELLLKDKSIISKYVEVGS
jgi:predicted RNase H-like HicB family nuclease